MTPQRQHTTIAYIYGLVCPISNAIRYVGKTTHPSNRLSSHLCDPRRSHKSNWIQALRKSGLRPSMRALQVVDHACWKEAESRWIATLRSQGCDLTNIAAGGNGSNAWTDEMRAKLKAAKMGHPVHESTRAKLSAMYTGVPRPERRGVKLSDEHKAKLRAARANQIMKPPTQEFRDLMRCKRKQLVITMPTFGLILSESNRGNKREKCTSDYYGVNWVKSSRKWMARARKPTESPITIGRFTSEMDAAIARDLKVLEWGLDYPLNFPLLAKAHPA